MPCFRFLLCLWSGLVIGALPALTQVVGNPMSRRPPPDPMARPVELPTSKQVSANDSFQTPVNLVKLQDDASQLAELAKSLPADINQVNRGLLPKDVIEKLKRIEKLSKRLRNELAP